MARDDAAPDGALRPLAPGPLIRIGHGALAVEIAPQAGGRIARVAFDGVEWLVGHNAGNAAAIAWGSFPMLPWAGRVRHGRFDFRGEPQRLPVNLGAHAIHGVALDLPWQVEEHAPARVALSLRLPQDERWPFGGTARQLVEADERRLQLTLTLSAGERAMPATIGWHPWFPKPDALDFRPGHYYPRDAEGIARLPLAGPPPGPWDDCFVNREPVLLRRGGQCLRLASDCDHWVVYDEPAHATCVEPQSGPPDAFNLGRARELEPGESFSVRFLWEWVSA
jgi:aldose 1-epimerase